MAVFEKSERIRHIGHLDLMRATQRALRRSGLPIGYSKGFTPHVQVAFASALSTGAVGLREIMDVQMAEGAVLTAEEFKQAMNRALPPEMQISEAKLMDDRHPGLMGMVQAAEYNLMLRDETAAQKMIEAIPAFLEQETIMAMRKTKSGIKEVDIRPSVFEVSGSGCCIHALLKLTERESCKPDMLMAALSAFCGLEEAPYARVIRLGLYGEDASGKLTHLEEM